MSVARCALLEVRPIHMPNHQSASRLATVLNAAAAAAATAMPTCKGGMRTGRPLQPGAAFVPALVGMMTVVLTEYVWLVKVPLWFVIVVLAAL